MLIANCGSGSMQAQQAAAKVSNGESSTNTSASNGEINEPLVAADSMLKVSDLPNDIIDIIKQTPTAGSNTIVKGLLSTVGCTILNTVLSAGASYYLGPFAATVVPFLTHLIFKCGSTNSSLVGLIPGGSSQTNQVMAVVSQIMQVVTQGKDPSSIINAIKNPQDLSAVLNIVEELLKKTNDPKLVQIFTLVNTFLSAHDGNVGTCGSMNTVACEVFNIVNEIRAGKGLPALVVNNKCVAEAQAHAKDLFTNLILSHSSSDGTSVKDRMLDFGILGAWAENIVKGQNLTPEQAVEMWMNSAGHAKNILNSTFTGGGVGYINGYFTQCLTN
jgi:uncharacterized protein YkwD